MRKNVEQRTKRMDLFVEYIQKNKWNIGISMLRYFLAIHFWVVGPAKKVVHGTVQVIGDFG